MRHARDGLATATHAITRALVVWGRQEPRESDNPEVSWSQRTSDGVSVPTLDGQHVQIGIECAARDHVAEALSPRLRAYVGVEKATDIVAQTTADGVRMLAVLHGPDAPTELRFPVKLASGLGLEPVPSGGQDIVHLRYGVTVGRIYSPWASDSMFRHVKADYTMDGSTVVMRVEHEGADYPVVADIQYSRNQTARAAPTPAAALRA